MVIIDIFRAEALLHSVRGIQRLTLSAGDAVECPIINKRAHALIVAIPVLKPENVFFR